MHCSECGEAVEDGSRFCRFCGARQIGVQNAPVVATPLASTSKVSALKWVAALGGGMLIVVVLVLASGPPSTVPPASNAIDLNSAADSALEDTLAAAAGEPASGAAHGAAASNWTYSTDQDKVRGGTTYFAMTTSTNSIHQNPPYDSDTTMTLTVRHAPSSGLNVMLQISSGQMMCPSYEGCSGTVRFDSGPAQHVRFSGPADNSSDTIFLQGEKAFLARLRKAKHLVVEKTLYEAGDPQFEFDVSGLKWEH